MGDRELDTLEQLLAEFRALRESVARNEVDRGTFGARTADLRARGQALGIDFTDEINQLRQLGQFDIDLTGVINQLRELDQLARSGTLTQEQFRERADRLRNAPIVGESGEGDSISGELDRIEEAGDFIGAFGGSLTESASAAFLFFEGLNAVTGAINGIIAPIRRAIQLQEEFQSNVLKSQILFVSATVAYDEAGNQIFDSTERLRASTKDFEELNKNLEIATQSIAGLTSARLTSVTREVTKNIGLIQGQSQQLGSTLEIIEGLVPDIAGALATLGLPELQDTQEIRELLRGQFNDQRALLGVQLGISKQEADIARQQGRFVDLLRERLAPFVAGNKIASERLGSVLVNFQDTQEILARAFAEEFTPPLVEAANDLFKALVVGTRNQEFTDQINELNTLNSLTAQYASLQERLADTTGLSEGQIEQLNTQLEKNRDAFSKLRPEIQALAGTDTSEEILRLNKELLELDPTPFETFQSFLQDLGRELGNTVDILIQQVSNIVRTLDSIGITDAVVRGGEAVIEVIGTINAILGFTTDRVTDLVNALERLPGATQSSGEQVEAVFAGIRGEASKVPEELQQIDSALQTVATDSTDVGKSVARAIGLEFLNAGLVRLSSAIVANFGPLQRLISFLKGIPGLGRLITPLISQFGLLGKIIPGIGTALLALDVFKLAKNVTREVTGANQAVRDFVSRTERELDQFEFLGEKARNALAGISPTSTPEERRAVQQFVQSQVDAIQERIKAKEDELKSDREIRKELEAQGKDEDEINTFLKNRVNLSNVEKEVRDEQTKAIQTLKLEEQALRDAAAKANVALKTTRIEARAIQDQGLIGTTAIQNFRNAIQDISNDVITVPDQLSEAVNKALKDADTALEAGLSVEEIEAGLLALSEKTNISTEDRLTILTKISQVRKQDLETLSQELRIQNEIADLQREAGIISAEQNETIKANNRLLEANRALTTAETDLANIRKITNQEDLANSKALRDAEQTLAKARAEQAAASANFIAVQGRLEAEQSRRRIKEAEELNKQLVNDRKRAAIEQGRFFEAEELQIRDRFRSQQEAVKNAEANLRATEKQIAATSDETELIRLQAQADRERTTLSQTRLTVAETERDIIQEIAELDEQFIRDARATTSELELQRRLAGGFADVSKENLAVNEALTNVIAESGNLQSLINQGEKDENKITAQTIKQLEAIQNARRAIVGLANREVDAVTRLELEQQQRDGLITAAEKELDLAIAKSNFTKEAIEEQEKLIEGLRDQGIPFAEEDVTLAELKLKLLEDTQNILEANVGIIEEELKLQRQVTSAGEDVLNRQQQIINKISSNLQKETQEVLGAAQENIAQTQTIVQQLQAGELDGKERLQAIRELGKIDPVAAAQAAQGRFEAAADSIRRREQEVARIKTNAAKEEEELAEKRLKIEQAIEAIKLQSRLAEIQLEKAKADNIEDPEVRRETLQALNAEERLIGVQQDFLRDPDSVDLDDIGNVFDVQDIDVGDVTRQVRADNDAIRAGTESQGETKLIEGINLLTNRAISIEELVKSLESRFGDLEPEVNITVSPGTLDPNLNTNVLRGEN